LTQTNSTPGSESCPAKEYDTMKKLNIYKASPYTSRQEDIIEDVEISINTTIPNFKTIQEQDDFSQEQADALEFVLYGVLPGCIYDRLLGNMLARKSTHYIVRHAL
jgi:hypothetical protein